MRSNLSELRFCCYKILPLVYDESLSYYEVLCKMRDYINKMLGDIKELESVYQDLEEYIAEYFEEHGVEDLIREIVTDWMEENMSTFYPFYNVTYYGVEPNTGDVYDDLVAMLQEKVYYTGGTVYFPKGKYTLSYTIFVPENTTFMGAGEESEIYFDETDQWMGVALANAGSNVSIKNLKVSHKTTGVFHNFAQPGAIGFSDIVKETVLLPGHTHQVVRGSVHNLTAENILFGGNFAIQTQPSVNNAISNIVYRNLRALEGCVSVKTGNSIDNVLIENIECDLFRIVGTNDSATRLNGCKCTNIQCRTFQISALNSNEDTIIIENLKQRSGSYNNDIIPEFNTGVLGAPVVFRNCVFISDSARYNGIRLYKPHRTFDHCTFNMYGRIFQNIAAVDNDNYEIMNNCFIRNTASNAGSTILIGYGTNNFISGYNIENLLWGDMHKNVDSGVAEASSRFDNICSIDETSLSLKVYCVCTNTQICELDEGLAGLPILAKPIQFFIGKSSVAGSYVPSFGYIENGIIVNDDPGTYSDTDYNRAIIDTTLELTRKPTPLEIYNAFH